MHTAAVTFEHVDGGAQSQVGQPLRLRWTQPRGHDVGQTGFWSHGTQTWFSHSAAPRLQSRSSPHGAQSALQSWLTTSAPWLQYAFAEQQSADAPDPPASGAEHTPSNAHGSPVSPA